jgi:hypothetical protein
MATGTFVRPNGRVGIFTGLTGAAGGGGRSIGLGERLAGTNHRADAHNAERFDKVPAGNIVFFHRIFRLVQTLAVSECRLFLDSFSALTRTARRPLTGHSCSQTPQPVQSAGSM